MPLFWCHVCGQSLKNMTSLKVHLTHQHNQRDWRRWFAPSSGDCKVCMFTFHNRYRLLRHWKVNQRCRNGLELGMLQQLTEDQVRLADRADAEMRRLCKQNGVHESSGPPPRALETA